MFIVMEIQSGDKTSTIVDSFENREQAENKYYSILAYASVSEVPIHSAVMLTAEGYYIKSEHYEHQSEKNTNA